MTITRRRSDKTKFIFSIVTILLIIIVTILYFVFFKGKASKPSNSDHTTKEQVSKDTTTNPVKDVEGSNPEHETSANVRKTIINPSKKIDETSILTFESTSIHALDEKLNRYINEVRDIEKIVETKLFYALESLLKTDITWAIEALKIREGEKQPIQTPDCPGIVITSTLNDLFDRAIKEINEKATVDPNELGFLNLFHINQIFEEGDIKKYIKIEDLKNVKKSLLENVPISILIDLEIRLLEIKKSIIKYGMNLTDKYIETARLLEFEYQKLTGAERDEKLGKLKTLFDSNTFQEGYMSMKDEMTTMRDEATMDIMKILKKLNKLNDFIMKKSKIS